MGDMADLLIDQWDFDGEFAFGSYRGGGSGIFETDVFCKFCGRGPYDWKLTDQGWRLFTQEREVMHRCKAYYKIRKEPKCE